MTHTITVLPANLTFPINDDETILDAALRANVILPYGCRDGACGSCKAKYIEGDVDIGMNNALTPDDYQQGILVTCKTTVSSDVIIQANVAQGGTFPIKKLPTRLSSMTRVTDDVMILQLQLPANDVFEYQAGQYIDILLRDGTRRSYSMATPPRLEEKSIELHIRHMPGGVFTDALFSTVKERDIFRIEGPLGTFHLSDNPNKPLILLASGTGFAPIKALVEELIAQGNTNRRIALYWGGRRPQDLYLHELAQQWAQDLPDFHYHPVISDALPEDQWSGRTGFVHLAPAADYHDMSEFEVYACGAPIVVDSARALYTRAHHLPETAFFADSFLSARDKVGVDTPSA